MNEILKKALIERIKKGKMNISEIPEIYREEIQNELEDTQNEAI